MVDGELPDPVAPIIPGHEIVGRIDAIGPGVEGLSIGERVGIPWLGHTCGTCRYCRAGQENLCDRPGFTGYTLDGGFATSAVADARFAFPLGEIGTDEALAPLLCAGLIGWRSLAMAGAPEASERLGLYGFGAAAHIVAQVARWQERPSSRSHGRATRPPRTSPGASGPPGPAVPTSHRPNPSTPPSSSPRSAPSYRLRCEPVRKGGRVISAGIHMSDIPSFAYSLLWEERELRSVANLTRADGIEFLRLAPEIGIVTTTSPYPLSRANEALADLPAGRSRAPRSSYPTDHASTPAARDLSGPPMAQGHCADAS